MHIRPSNDQRASAVLHGRWQRDGALRAVFHEDFEAYLQAVSTILETGLHEMLQNPKFTA